MDIDYHKEIGSVETPRRKGQRRHFNLNLAAAWCGWITVSCIVLLCILPVLFGTSLWMAHIYLTLEPASDLEWTKTIDEGIELFSLFSSDLSGVNRHRTNADFASISANTYTFDFSSWCRRNSDKLSVVCYRGEGLNIASAFVTDIGAQIAEVGHSDDPQLFGQSLSLTYRRIIKELDHVYHFPEDNTNFELDMNKLQMTHILHVYENLGKSLLNMRIGYSILVMVVTIAIWVKEILSVQQNFFFLHRCELAFRWSIFVFLTACVLMSSCFFFSEVILVCRLNNSLQEHGIYLRLGLGNMLLLGETILGVILTIVVSLRH